MKDTAPLKPTIGQRSMNARMAQCEAERLLAMYRAMPHSSFYALESERTGKVHNVKHDDALYVLTTRGMVA